MLGGHPLLGLSLKLAARLVVLQRADPASGDGRVQVHVGAVESIGGVVKVSQGERRAALEMRDRRPSAAAQSDRTMASALWRCGGRRREQRTGIGGRSVVSAAIASALRARR